MIDSNGLSLNKKQHPIGRCHFPLSEFKLFHSRRQTHLRFSFPSTDVVVVVVIHRATDFPGSSSRLVKLCVNLVFDILPKLGPSFLLIHLVIEQQIKVIGVV